MIAAILVFFLAIFFGFALLGITTYLYSRRLKSKKIRHFSSSGDYAAIHNSHDTNKYLENEFVSSYIYTPGGYIEEEDKSENLTETAKHSSIESDYSSTEGNSIYDSSDSSPSDFSSGSDSGSNSSSSD